MSNIIEKLKKNRILSDFLTPKALAQFKRYLITGFLSFGIEYSIFYILYDALKLWYIPSNSIAMVTGFVVSFLLNRFWSFQSKDNPYRQLLLYALLFVFNLAFSNLLMYLLSDIAGITPLISKVLVMGIIVVWNFILYKKIIYR